MWTLGRNSSLTSLPLTPLGENFDFKYWRERFQTLFAEPLDWESRAPLLQSYAATLDMVERALVSQGRDLTEFRNARETDWRTLCLQEALHRSGTDLFEADDLNEIVQREVAAGRMPESSFTQLASDGAAVLGKRQQTNQSRKKGLFRRLFG